MVSLEVEGRSSPIKRRAILKIIGTSLHYWHAPLLLDPTGPPTLDKGQLASPHVALLQKHSMRTLANRQINMATQSQ